MEQLSFYERFVQLFGNLKDIPDRATPYKIEYLKNIIKDNKVYKFISFDGDVSLVRTKIDTLKQGNIWFSFYKTLNDESEFQIRYKVKKISRKTGRTTENIHLLVNYLTELYDVYSLTYAYQNYMWEDYASNGNGICIEYEVENYDYLYPVEYVNKLNIDFDKMIISAINDNNPALSIIPWVIKNPYNQTANLNSTREKEVRILYCPYEKEDINEGRVEWNIKERLGYKGIIKPYEDFGLTISKIVIGDKCSQGIISELQEFCMEKEISYILRS